MSAPSSPPPARPWLTRTVMGLVLATFLSDLGHEMCTAVLPLYLGSVGMGAMALGLIEGVADFLVSLSKLGGGLLGHRVREKRPWASLGYLATTVATAAIGLVTGLAAMVSLRTAAWIGRGFRSPLRDAILADAVEPSHFGRAYGLERAGDMLGAVAGPLMAALLVWAGIGFRDVILWSIVPGMCAAGAMFFLIREPGVPAATDVGGGRGRVRPAFPKAYWLLVVGVFLFGLGDFSRSFIVFLAARGIGEVGAGPGAVFSGAVLLYALHNGVSALAAYPVGRLGDRYSKVRLLLGGYSIGAATNLLLAAMGGSLGWLAGVIVLSGVYIAVEETLEKAAVAELLPKELRSLGFGILASANAVGDMASSVYVGYLLSQDRPGTAFGIAAAFGVAGILWLWLSGVGGRRGGPADGERPSRGHGSGTAAPPGA